MSVSFSRIVSVYNSPDLILIDVNMVRLHWGLFSPNTLHHIFRIRVRYILTTEK